MPTVPATNITYRASTSPTLPSAVTAKGSTLTTDEMDGNLKSLATGVDARAHPSANQTWAAQRGTVTVLSPAATITPDFSLSNNFSLTINQNFTMAFPTNVAAGQSGIIVITQDASGSRLVTWASGWVAAGANKPVLSLSSNSVDYISYYVETSSRIFVNIIANVS